MSKNKMLILSKEESLQVLDGLLLSDGCIRIEKKYKNARFTQKSKYLEYAFWLKKFFECDLGISCPPSEPQDAGKGSYGALSLGTNVSILLTEQRTRWYPDGTKIVPKDIEIYPQTLKHWFIGDGNLSYCNGRFERIKLATNGFSDRDREILQNRLKELGFPTKISNLGELYINKSLLSTFLSFIGECPVHCYSYKWVLNNWELYSSLKENQQDNQQRSSYLAEKAKRRTFNDHLARE